MIGSGLVEGKGKSIQLLRDGLVDTLVLWQSGVQALSYQGLCCASLASDPARLDTLYRQIKETWLVIEAKELFKVF
jgi:hypothetical protein